LKLEQTYATYRLVGMFIGPIAAACLLAFPAPAGLAAWIGGGLAILGNWPVILLLSPCTALEKYFACKQLQESLISVRN
jgi:hypothetical protein